MIDIASEVTGHRVRYVTVPEAVFRMGGLFSPSVEEVSELLPRYRDDNLFDSSRFRARFPGFTVTTYREGIAGLLG